MCLGKSHKEHTQIVANNDNTTNNIHKKHTNKYTQICIHNKHNKQHKLTRNTQANDNRVKAMSQMSPEQIIVIQYYYYYYYYNYHY